MNSKEWWDSVKSNPDKLNNWLLRQYRGEVTAGDRIRKLATDNITTLPEKDYIDLYRISVEEKRHAKWVGWLLFTRGIDPVVKDAEARYWSKTLPVAAKSSKHAYAVGAHAEAMRLERIKVIAEDESSPPDIRIVFSNILRDEIGHEETFRRLAGPEMMQEVLPSHQEGLALLGLTP